MADPITRLFNVGSKLQNLSEDKEKAISGYGWHGGDVIGLILLGFLPGAALAGAVFNND